MRDHKAQHPLSRVQLPARPRLPARVEGANAGIDVSFVPQESEVSPRCQSSLVTRQRSIPASHALSRSITLAFAVHWMTLTRISSPRSGLTPHSTISCSCALTL
jgi:hypothetical protein